jgi:hypothetical protein
MKFLELADFLGNIWETYGKYSWEI